MKVVLRLRKDNGKYRYIHDENMITVKTFDTEKSAFKFLNEYAHNLIPQGKDNKFLETGWECITFQDFKEELKIHGAIVYN